MVRVLAYLLLAALLFSPATGFAESETDPVITQEQDDLLETQKRLEALIKAAIDNDVINAEEKKPDEGREKDAHGTATHTKTPAHVSKDCVAEEIFEIPHESHVADYQSLVTLKNSIIVGPSEVDEHKVRLLVLAYIGLGFGEEALDFTAFLSGREARVLVALAHSVSGDVTQGDVKVLTEQMKCADDVALWASFASIQLKQGAKLEDNQHSVPASSGDHDEHGGSVKHSEGVSHDDNTDSHDAFKLSPDQLKQIEALPTKIGAIMAKRFGVYAVTHESMNTATDLLKMLKKAQKKNPVPGIFDDEEKYFEAMFYLNQNDRRAFPILNALAQQDGPLQVRALQTLGVVQTQTGELAYPGFEDDLDGAAHVFSQHPEGQQALAEKINLFVATDRIDQAIGMTKEKFLPHEDYYINSVLRVSQRMQIYLTGDDDKKKLYALNTLLREQIFFDALKDGFPLRRDGVGASLDLGLPELAPKILPVEEWGRLDVLVLQELALALPDDMKGNLPQKAFSGEKHDVLKIQAAFDKKQPKTAMKALRGMAGNEEALEMAAHASWKNGYWSLARETNEKLNELRGGSGDSAVVTKTKLASALSVPSPFLTSASTTKNIGDYRALQTFLDNDIETIKDYVNDE